MIFAGLKIVNYIYKFKVFYYFFLSSLHDLFRKFQTKLTFPHKNIRHFKNIRHN